MTLPEQLPLLNFLFVWVVPFAAYFLGIFIRKYVFPGASDLSLSSLFLLGIPVCLIIVSPLIATLQEAFRNSPASYLFTIGIIIEHGMIVHETAAKRLAEYTQKQTDETQQSAKDKEN